MQEFSEEFEDDELEEDNPELSIPSELHLTLQGFYHALATQVTDPVCVDSGFDGDCRFEKMYYDCTDDEKEGRNIMARRIKYSSDTIKKFLEQHQAINDIFASIEEAANVQSVGRVEEHTNALIDKYKAHIEFIKLFREGILKN